MAKYEVVRPWFGVKVGDVVELKELHPALKSNVRLMKGEAGGELKPATPDAGNLELTLALLALANSSAAVQRKAITGILTVNRNS
ncbi:hypothetical protein SR76_11530 [Enterobacter hormaechei subsp. steigerwaltii]|uniref:hypothetical protein n=1 Tax=Enterobacter hormaechei TaxID=158836 RepID=UPI0005F069BF|nr:hypothetical protein [Enterobacter hormaechei]KJP72575.1 hypothetical protein SR76_11530 [Enterobacter hormaechei subsp. steigerwaltii]